MKLFYRIAFSPKTSFPFYLTSVTLAFHVCPDLMLLPLLLIEKQKWGFSVTGG